MKFRSAIIVPIVAAMLIPGLFTSPAGADEAGMTAVEKGKEIAWNRKKGNCLTCHSMAGGKLTGNIGPPLINMKARFPDKAKLRAKIWDIADTNPNTIMPRFGKYMVLTPGEVDLVTEYVWNL
jgi:sulfur-oxidizing protein SoxX